MAGFAEEKGYKMKERLGAGCFGTVYLAEKVSEKKKTLVAVKLFHKKDNSWVWEVEMLKSVSNCDHVVKILGHHESSTTTAIVLELCGQSLTHKYSEQAPTHKEAAAILYHSLIALKEVHLEGMMHCDIKADNILFCKEPTLERALVLADFGLARPADEDDLTFAPYFWQMARLPSYVFYGGLYGQKCEVHSLILMIIRLLNINIYGDIINEEINKKALLERKKLMESQPCKVLTSGKLEFLEEILLKLKFMGEFEVKYDVLLEMLKARGAHKTKFWKRDGKCAIM